MSAKCMGISGYALLLIHQHNGMLEKAIIVVKCAKFLYPELVIVSLLLSDFGMLADL